jgi:hypothetical protein
LGHQLLELLGRVVTLGAVDRLELCSVDGDELGAEQLEFAAEQIELLEHPFEAGAVVLAEVGDGFEIRPQAAQ